jgi:CDP-diacylglycerol--glycerol-3-phosphate 3-phosphatidyltransferase
MMTKARDRKLTISNVITISRLIALPFIVYFLITDQRIIAFIIMLISLLSDAVDGYLARKLHQESELGKSLDPVCDKIFLAVILITLYVIGSIPLWGVIVIVSRDFFILLGSFFILRLKSTILTSNLLGKITGFIFGVIICAFTLNLRYIGMVFLFISIPAIIGTFTIYTVRYIKVMKGVA